MLTSLRVALAGALLAYVGVLTYVLLTPQGSVPSGLVTDFTNLGQDLGLPGQILERDRVEFGLNVLAFVPLSLLGSLLRPSVRVSTWIAMAFATSLLVEAYQTTQPERMAAHSDVVANTAGAASGAIVAWLLLLPFAARSRAS
jgi:glycopeptide antibiotics resistance protein